MPPALLSLNSALSIPRPLDLRSVLSSLPRHAPRDILSSPTRSLSPATLASLIRRQVVTVTANPVANPIIPAYYSTINSSPTPGTVVGIVFGSVGGFLLLLWLIYTCFTFGTTAWGRSSIVEEDVVRRRTSRSVRPSHHSSHSRSEVIEVSRTRERSRTRSPTRSRSRSRSRTRSPPRSSRRETIVIEETTRRPARTEREDDVVEVFEEHSPVRRESVRGSVRRESSRRSKIEGGFRTVDPEAYGGGDRPMRKVSRRD